MSTKTEIANLALTHLAAETIISLDDPESATARIIAPVFEPSARQVIRMHRWSSCMKRARLTELAASPLQSGAFGYQHAFRLPTDCLRVCDLNAEHFRPGGTYEFDLNGRDLLTNNPEVYLRYVAYEPDPVNWDELLAEAVAVRLAMRVARRVTKDGVTADSLFPIYQKVIADARAVDAMETGSGETRNLERLLGNSPVVNAGRQGRYSRTGFFETTITPIPR